ncbi:hypothetical protein I79_017393 [Cricetulus griseus]|uniref:Uncharacterized protein n=1 Tax=Cricetulus griseus TaxID=10029 RepID=G3I1X9_CRIGR|nr:hypothetical protein I79_017393 [Cricetulus griseus]
MNSAFWSCQLNITVFFSQLSVKRLHSDFRGPWWQRAGGYYYYTCLDDTKFPIQMIGLLPISRQEEKHYSEKEETFPQDQFFC